MLIPATVIHCVQPEITNVTHVDWIDKLLMATWGSVWVAFNFVAYMYACRFKRTEVELVKKLGLTRSADAGQGRVARKGVSNGKITNVRKMLEKMHAKTARHKNGRVLIQSKNPLHDKMFDSSDSDMEHDTSPRRT